MTTVYPGLVDTFGNPLSTTPLAGTAGSLLHNAEHANVNDAVIAVETKLGTGASTAAANQVLRGTGAGVTSFGQIDNNYIATAAGILVSKLAAGGTANRVVKTSDGTNITLAQIASADIAANAVSQFATVAPTNNSTITGGPGTVPNSHVTLNTSANGGIVLLLMWGVVYQTGAGGGVLTVQLMDGVSGAGTGSSQNIGSAAALVRQTACIALAIQPSAASHDYSIQWTGVSSTSWTWEAGFLSTIELKR
jgi:hypothetical protein